MMEQNNSSSNETYPSFSLDYNDFERVSIIFVMGLFTVLAIPGNSIVIFVVARVQNMKTSTNLLLLNLCIADLFIAVFNLPFITVDLYITEYWIFGEFMFVMMALYIKIGQKLWQTTRKTSSMRHPNTMSKATLSSKTRLTKICVVIILSFALSWAPAHIITLHHYSTDGFSDVNEATLLVIYPIVSGISYSNCALNPLLYCFMSQNFRNAIYSEWKRLTTKRRRKMYGGLPGMSLRGRDSILRTISLRIQGSIQLSKEQDELENDNTKHRSLELETSLTIFESAL